MNLTWLILLLLQIVCFQLSYFSPTFYNLIGIQAKVTRGTHSLWMQVH